MGGDRRAIVPLAHLLGKAHAIDVFRALGASREGLTFSTIRRVTQADSRTVATFLKDFEKIGLAEHERGSYRLTKRGVRVLETLAQLHTEAGVSW